MNYDDERFMREDLEEQPGPGAGWVVVTATVVVVVTGLAVLAWRLGVFAR